jgi:hypothetical protein
VCWPKRACSLIEKAEGSFLPLVANYAWLNPHLTLSAKVLGDHRKRLPTDLSWTKWASHQPASPHWYDQKRLAGLMAAEIPYAEDHGLACPSVRDFIRQSRGLKGTTKANDICETLNIPERASLADSVRDGLKWSSDR